MKIKFKTNKCIALIAVVIIIIVLLIIGGISIVMVTGDNGTIIATMKVVGDKSTEKPLVPTGFIHTEGTVDNGYVIQDENGNEFVWVPVDKNQKIEINVTSKKDIESITLQDPYGDNILTVNDEEVEKTYMNEEVEPTINGAYVLKVTTSSGEESFTLGVHSLYAQDTFKDWEIENMPEEEIKELEEEINYEVEALETEAAEQGYDTVEEYANVMLKQEGEPTLEEMGFATVREYAISTIMPSLSNPDMKDYEDTEDYTESVNENGGFYIGRYEASYDNGKVSSKKSTVANESVDLENGKLLNWISQEDALTNAKSMYESEEFTSSLLTGAAWDRTLGWLEETGAVTAYEILVASETWGNYYDDEFSNTKDIANTGEFKETEKNHIYDLAGNLEEWTTEAHYADVVSQVGYYADVVSQGGYYAYSGSFIPSSTHNFHNPSSSYQYVGFRPALYVK